MEKYTTQCKPHAKSSIHSQSQNIVQQMPKGGNNKKIMSEFLPWRLNTQKCRAIGKPDFFSALWSHVKYKWTHYTMEDGIQNEDPITH